MIFTLHPLNNNIVFIANGPTFPVLLNSGKKLEDGWFLDTESFKGEREKMIFFSSWAILIMEGIDNVK